METRERLLGILATTGLVGDMSRYEFDKSFKQNGIDSLDVMTVLLSIEEEWGTTFSEDEAGTIRSLADAARLLEARH
jgi:acyl carrier protein